MPYSWQQVKAARADLGRVRAGKAPRTFKGMSESKLHKWAGAKKLEKPKHHRKWSDMVKK